MSNSRVHLENVIVGSGPTAWATALGLLEKGDFPTLIDFGPDPWSSSSRISRSSKPALKGSSSSDELFAYPASLVASADKEYLPLTSARGGLSQIWGAGVLVRDFKDFEGLEAISEDLRFAYECVSKKLYPLGSDDQTSRRFSLPSGSTRAPQSKRYKSVLSKIENRNFPGVLFGSPRIAFSNPASNCTLCGLCRSGCPESLFFNARRTIEGLAEHKFLSILDGPVIQLRSTHSRLEIQLPGKVVTADKAFLCAGPVGTPALLQRSGMIAGEFAIPDSAVFYGVCWNSSPSNGDEEKFASSHMVAYSTAFGPDDFQIAFYESHPELSERLTQLLKIPNSALKIPRPIQSRLNPLIGFLDSTKSGKLILRKSGDRTVVFRVKNSDTRRAAKHALSRVALHCHEFGLHIFSNIFMCPPVGSGYHSGASMPINGEYVNLDGSLKGNENIYVTDASSLPHLWAGSHTYAAMANAFRIAYGS